MTTKKRSKWPIILIAVVLVLTLLSVRAVRLRRATTVYELYQVNTGTIVRTVSGLGKVAVINKEIMFATAGGQISRLNVTVGDTVQQGTVLLRTAAGTEVKAPFDGEVTALFVKANEWVNPGARLVEVTDYNNLEITAQVDELDIAKITRGQSASIDINALESEDLTGTITSMAKEGVFSGGITTFGVKVSIPDATGLLVGMSAEVKVETNRAAEVLIVPIEAVLYDGEQPYVLLQGEKAKPQTTNVELGLSDGQFVEITSGLSVGQTIMYEMLEAEDENNFGPGPGFRGMR